MQYTCNFINTGKIGCVTATKATPISPVLYSRNIISGGVQPVGQITSSSGERPLSPSFGASTAAQVSEQSTQQRSVYFSTSAGEAMCVNMKVMKYFTEEKGSLVATVTHTRRPGNHSLVPRPSITANTVEGLVKLLRRMTSGGCLVDVWRRGTLLNYSHRSRLS